MCMFITSRLRMHRAWKGTQKIPAPAKWSGEIIILSYYPQDASKSFGNFHFICLQIGFFIRPRII